MHISATSIISLDREKIRLSFAVLFVCVPFIEPEILPFYQCGGSPLVSILKKKKLDYSNCKSKRPWS